MNFKDVEPARINFILEQTLFLLMMNLENRSHQVNKNEKIKLPLAINAVGGESALQLSLLLKVVPYNLRGDV